MHAYPYRGTKSTIAYVDLCFQHMLVLSYLSSAAFPGPGTISQRRLIHSAASVSVTGDTRNTWVPTNTGELSTQTSQVKACASELAVRQFSSGTQL